MITVRFDETAKGKTLLELLRERGLPINSVCGGIGICGKCVVKVERGDISEPTERELEILGDKIGKFRLACQTKLRGEVEVSIPLRSLTRVEPIRTGGKELGVAIDLGTTNLTGYLVDLESGTTLGLTSLPNPQCVYGEDVMTRLAAALEGKDLRKPLLTGVLRLMERLTAEPENIREIVVVGNSAMHHFFLGLPLSSLALFPFTPHSSGPMRLHTKEVGLDLEAEIYSPPLIGGFVGSDCVSDLLYSNLHTRKTPWLLVDIGTNTEIVASDGSRMVACSCASGPAFEGGRITCGMRAGEGAIWRVKLTENLEPLLECEGKPEGICGSGAISLLSELLRLGVVSPDGRMKRGVKNVRGEAAFFLTENVFFTQSDVRELQLAKSAVATGVHTLLELLGLETRQISCMSVAGNFGFSLDLEAAVRIGMLPEVPEVSVLGNAAGMGAVMMLISEEKRKTAEELAKKVEYVQLPTEGFEEKFLRLTRLEKLH